jgi:hypothetical protein
MGWKGTDGESDKRIEAGCRTRIDAKGGPTSVFAAAETAAQKEVRLRILAMMTWVGRCAHLKSLDYAPV